VAGRRRVCGPLRAAAGARGAERGPAASLLSRLAVTALLGAVNASGALDTALTFLAPASDFYGKMG